MLLHALRMSLIVYWLLVIYQVSNRLNAKFNVNSLFNILLNRTIKQY